MLNANNDKNDNSYPEVLVSSVSLLGPSEVLSVLTVSSMAMSLAELAIQVGDTAVLFSLSLQIKLSYVLHCITLKINGQWPANF